MRFDRIFLLLILSHLFDFILYLLLYCLKVQALFFVCRRKLIFLKVCGNAQGITLLTLHYVLYAWIVVIRHYHDSAHISFGALPGLYR